MEKASRARARSPESVARLRVWLPRRIPGRPQPSMPGGHLIAAILKFPVSTPHLCSTRVQRAMGSGRNKGELSFRVWGLPTARSSVYP